MQRVKLAFVGCGAISLLHLKAVQENNKIIYVSVVIDPDASKTSHLLSLCSSFVSSPSNPPVVSFSSLQEAITANSKALKETGESLFDAVDLMLPHHLHHKIAIESFNAGLHVLLEKPMAPTIEECDDILKTANQNDKVFMVAENSQYWPEVVRAKQLIEEGKIGELITARAVYTEATNDSRYRTEEQKDEWRNNANLAGGGIALDGGSHWIRPLRMWFGEIDEVIGLLGYPLKSMQGESLVKAIKADTIFSADPWWRILGEKGEITIESENGIMLYTKDHPLGVRELVPPQGYMGSFAPELEDFAKVILKERQQPAASASMSLGELRTALAIYKSVHNKQWTKVWDDN